MTDSMRGIHHTAVLTSDLDGLVRTFTAFGFTLSPRSRHLLGARPGQAPVLGCTANQCALFGDSYIELLGIVDEHAPDPWHTREMAKEYEGFRILNLETDDAEATARRLADAGLGTTGVLDLEREVDTEEGRRTVRARAVHLDPGSTPEGYVGVAQHHTRHHVHQPRYLTHRNGARGLGGVLIVADDAEFDAITRRYALIMRTTARQEGPTAVFDAGAARLRVLRASGAGEVLPGEPAPAPSYFAAMTIVVDDLHGARQSVESNGTATLSTREGFFVSARDAYGAGLLFVAA
jgi:hypothetical protein